MGTLSRNGLINYVELNVYEFISECENHDDAIQTLNSIYIKPKNAINARQILSTRKQKSDETLDQFLNELKTLAKDCNFTHVSA